MTRLFKCEDCGRTFGEDEIASWKESRGEFWGQSCYETMQGCPSCHSGDIEEISEEVEERNDNDG